MARSKKRPYTLVIDFETANTSPTSACSLGLVVIDEERIIHTQRFLIKTPSPLFLFTHIHGLTYQDVESAPTFGQVWAEDLKPWFEKASLLVAHNIGFDKRVLNETAALYGIRVPKMKSECTVKLSRYKLAIKPANLKNVSNILGISLNHHEALSDALASAFIYLHVTTGKKPWLEPIDVAPSVDVYFQDSLFDQSPQIVTEVKTQSAPVVLDLDKALQLNSEKSKALLVSLLTKKEQK